MPKTEVEKQLDKKFEGLENDIKTLKEQKEKSDKKSSVLKQALKKQGEELAKLLAGGMSLDKSFDTMFGKFLDTNKKAIKGLYKSGGVMEFNTEESVVKAADVITTQSGTTPTPANINNDEKLGDFNFESYAFIFKMVSKFSTSRASVPYTEMKPKDGDFEVVPEGDEKPQIDFTWVTSYAEPKVSAAYEVLTEQAVTDHKRLRSVAKGYLKKRHDIHKAKRIIQLAVDLGTANAFVAGDMADVIPNGKATFTDVVNALATDIATTHAYEDEKAFMPNIVMVHPTDFTVNFIFAKNSKGDPIYPNASVLNRANVGGITVIPNRLVTKGKILVADLSNIHLSDYQKYSVRIGWINDNFIHNQFVILGESTYHLYVKNQDKIAFRHSDYIGVKDAIEADA